jgi:hypothetical protein
VLGYALAVSTLATFVFGLAPARRAARFDLISSLKDEASGSAVTPEVASRTRRRTSRRLYRTADLERLFLRSLSHIGSIDPGFSPDGVLLARIELDETTHGRASGEALFLDLEQQVKASPAVSLPPSPRGAAFARE